METWRPRDSDSEDIPGAGDYTSDSEASSVGIGSVTTDITETLGHKKV